MDKEYKDDCPSPSCVDTKVERRRRNGLWGEKRGPGKNNTD